MADKPDLVTVKAVRTFDTPGGLKHPASDPFDAERSFAAELFANDLIEYADATEQEKAKAARAPKNKQAPAPANKQA